LGTTKISPGKALKMVSGAARECQQAMTRVSGL
jgi:microcompartment protein CcmL/EutN